jgi:hypothetical protein
LISVRSLSDRSVVKNEEYVQWILKRLRVRKYGAGGLQKTEAEVILKRVREHGGGNEDRYGLERTGAQILAKMPIN